MYYTRNDGRDSSADRWHKTVSMVLQLEGRKTAHRVKEAGSVPPYPSLSTFSPLSLSLGPSPLDALAHDLLCGEGAATEWRASEVLHPEPSKPPNLHDDKDLQEVGGASSTSGNVNVFHEDPDPLGLAGAAVNTDANAVEFAGVDAYEHCRP